MAYKNFDSNVYKSINEYTKQKYDRITILRTSGEKEKLNQIASDKGYRSLNEFINQAIDEKLKRLKIEL